MHVQNMRMRARTVTHLGVIQPKHSLLPCRFQPRTGRDAYRLRCQLTAIRPVDSRKHMPWQIDRHNAAAVAIVCRSQLSRVEVLTLPSCVYACQVSQNIAPTTEYVSSGLSAAHTYQTPPRFHTPQQGQHIVDPNALRQEPPPPLPPPLRPIPVSKCLRLLQVTGRCQDR
jgi:hypothetical protein